MLPRLLDTLSQSISSCLVGLITIPIRSQAQEGVSGLFKITELVNTDSRYHRCVWPLPRMRLGERWLCLGCKRCSESACASGHPQPTGVPHGECWTVNAVGSHPPPVRTSERWMSPRLLVPALRAGSSQAYRVLCLEFLQGAKPSGLLGYLAWVEHPFFVVFLSLSLVPNKLLSSGVKLILGQSLAQVLQDPEPSESPGGPGVSA